LGGGWYKQREKGMRKELIDSKTEVRKSRLDVIRRKTEKEVKITPLLSSLCSNG